MSNPFSIHHPWSPEVLKAYLDMPKNANGHVVSLLYLEGRELERMEPLWREWCRKYPKLWPTWIKTYGQQKNLGKSSNNINRGV